MDDLFGSKNRVVKKKVIIVTPTRPITEEGTDRLLYSYINSHIEKGARHFILDMSKSKLMGSSIGEIVNILNKLSQIKGSIKLCCLDKWSSEKMRVSRLSTIFEIHNTLKDCIDSFS